MDWKLVRKRIAYGSIGAELWSASALVYWGVTYLIIRAPGVRTASYAGVLIAWYPWGPAFLLLAGLIHTVALIVTPCFASIVMRKSLTALALLMWGQVAYTLYARNLAGSTGLVVIMCVLLFIAFTRRTYVLL